jgi:hypothetical protein
MRNWQKFVLLCRAEKTEYVISLFLIEITVHSGIVWRDKIYGDRRQISEKVEASTT